MRTARFIPYDMTNSERELHRRHGQRVEVTDKTVENVDVDEVGQMFVVRFADGFEADVFADELSEWQMTR